MSVILTLVALPTLAQAMLCQKLVDDLNKPTTENTSIYFVMPLKTGSCNLNCTIKLLPDLKKMQVKTLWLGPIHPQTQSEYGIHGKNDHGYWPADHGEVALGGIPVFKNLIEQADSRGIGIWMDAVIGHFGYGDSIKINGKEVSLKDSNYFIVSEHGSPLMNPRMHEISGSMEFSTDREQLIGLQKELAQFPIYHLPKIRTENPEMSKYLIDSYGKFVDMGVAGFRIDAAKHIELDFLKKFINSLQERGLLKNGKAPQFMLEMTIKSSETLDVMIQSLKEGAHDPDGVFAIDFPLAYEIRRLQDENYRFDWLVGFLNHRWQKKLNLKNLIPFVENHDFEGSIQRPFTASLAYALSDFFSGQAPIITHGLENSNRADHNNRRHIEKVDANADLTKMRSEIASSLGLKRREADSENIKIIKADDHLIAAERNIDNGKKLLVVANKSNESKTFNLSGKKVINIVYAKAESDLLPTLEFTGVSNLQLPPHSFIFLEIKQELK